MAHACCRRVVPADAATITNPELRTCIEKTISDLSEDYPYDPDVLGYFLVVEPGDSLATINTQLGFDILENKWTGIRFDQPGYMQSFEVLDEHANWFEMVFIISDDGFGIEVLIKRTPTLINVRPIVLPASKVSVRFSIPISAGRPQTSL